MINCSTYLFGMTSDGYFQYPMDSLKTQLQILAKNFNSESQIAVYRESNLMYYAYMRRMAGREVDSYMGICVLINGMATYNLASLFRMFESVYQGVVIEGKVLTVNNAGATHFLKITNRSLLSEHNRVSEVIKKSISDGENYFEEMPPINYSSYIDDYQVVSLTDGERKIRSKIEDNNIVYIIKNRGISNSAFNGMTLKIKQLSEELELQQAMSAELSQKLRQVKNRDFMANLSLYLLILLACIVIVFIYMYKHQLITINF